MVGDLRSKDQVQLSEFQIMLADEACKKKLLEFRKEDGFVCPHCKSPVGEVVSFIPGRYAIKCHNPKCQKQFSILDGTGLERSHLALSSCFWALCLYIDQDINPQPLKEVLNLSKKEMAQALIEKFKSAMDDPRKSQLLSKIANWVHDNRNDLRGRLLVRLSKKTKQGEPSHDDMKKCPSCKGKGWVSKSKVIVGIPKKETPIESPIC